MVDDQETQDEKERKIKQLHMVVCICKGINLNRVLKGLEGSTTVDDVNRKVGTGSGGCKGERCGPRIRLLLKKYADLKPK
jgi:bacterioferritin-associated ferredoxin